jgi:hypothetical protein
VNVDVDAVVRQARSGVARTSPAADTRANAHAAGDPRWIRRLAPACTAAAILPIVVAAARAIARDWVPVGDNAYFALRAGDVLTEHHPFLGTWTSASLTAGVDMNNPGPLFFDALALPVKLAGDAGLVVGVALINIAAILATAIVAHRQAGPRAVVVAMAAAAGLGWTMGSELLFSPWQPNALLFPALCFFVMVWALAAGDLAVLPWAVAVASFILQTHIGYALVVPLLGAWGLGAGVIRLVRSRSPDADPGELRGRLVRSAVAAVAVGLVCWAQPFYEQLFGGGRGNLGRLVSSVGDTGDTVGLADAPRYVAGVVALPPWWARPSMSETFVTGGVGRSLLASIVGLAVIAGLLATGWVWARRAGDNAGAAPATGLVAVGVAAVAVATVPIGLFGWAPSHQVLWLWPLALFVTMALVAPIATARAGTRVSGPAVVLVAVSAVTLGALNVPSTTTRLGPAADAASIPAVRELVSELAPLRGERGVLIDLRGQRFAEPYSIPVMLELERLGVPWFVDEAGQVRQVGDTRAYDGDASVRLFIREGEAARTVPEGARRVAFVEALSGAEAVQLAGLEDDLRSFIAGGGLVGGAVSPRGETVEWTDAQLRDAGYLFESRTLVGLVRDDRLRVPARWAEVLGRYADLQYQADRLTVAVFVEPLAGDR